MKEDTIVALSSAHGRSAVAVIRMSGKDGPSIFSKYFSGTLQNRKAIYGILDIGKIKDDVIAVKFDAPKSYTGEDCVEIYCHGSPTIVEGILQCFIKDGARQAERGEFTRRAFENGKLSLSEAEGVADLIEARSESGVKAAYSLASGALRKKIDSVYEKIANVNSSINVEIDYPEEETGASSSRENIEIIRDAYKETAALLATFDGGRKAANGVSVVIVGRPNSGKSTLLNALVGYDRAIVTEEEGTTRDTVEASYVYNGTLFVVTDTAGIRNNASSEAERLGIERSLFALKGADIALLLDDELIGEDFVGKKLKVNTKSDVVNTEREGLKVSGKSGQNIEKLKELIYENSGITASEEVMITNLRQYGELKKCIDSLKNALETMEKSGNTELATVDLLLAMSALKSVNGATAAKETVDGIFSRFCVGK